jgi:hypothetical protein
MAYGEIRIEPAPDGMLFASRTGAPIRRTTFRRSLDADCRRLGLLGVTRTSCASCASWVADSDGILEATRRFGHSRSSITTRHYAGPLVAGDRVVADRLDEARRKVQSGSARSIEADDVARMWHGGVRLTGRREGVN